MKTVIRKILHRAKRCVCPPCSQPHAFSQEGEDLILARIFERQPQGFYVDVGANHPTRFSNTYYFYQRGWRGINIDAMPGSMAAFAQMRPRDINVETAIGENPGTMMFHIFNDTALNTFDAALAKTRDGLEHYRIVEVKAVTVRTLAEVLAQHLPAQSAINFLSVDAEGFDLSVLRSNDWNRYVPQYVLAEDSSGADVEAVLQLPLAGFLRSVGYGLFAKTANTQIFRRKQP